MLQIYKAFGLGSSYAKVMKFNNMLQYSEYIVLQRAFPQVPPQFIDDLYQVNQNFNLLAGDIRPVLFFFFNGNKMVFKMSVKSYEY